MRAGGRRENKMGAKGGEKAVEISRQPESVGRKKGSGAAGAAGSGRAAEQSRARCRDGEMLDEMLEETPEETWPLSSAA